MCDSSAPVRANDVISGYKARVNDLQIQIAGLRTRKLWALAVILKGVLLFGALLLLAFHDTGFSLAAHAIPLVLVVWAVALRSFLRSRAKSIELVRRAAFYERGIDRMEDNWRGKGNTGTVFMRDHHLYQSDLDILGEGSV